LLIDVSDDDVGTGQFQSAASEMDRGTKSEHIPPAAAAAAA